MSNLTGLIPLLGALPIPTPDPLGYPVPVWALKGLTYLTLTLHFLAMQFTLGGAMFYLWIGVRKPAHGSSIQSYLGGSLPLGFSYLVTLGIPPLLFVQVLYGQLYYSSSVLIGAFWILVVPLLILAYGLFYLHKLTRKQGSGGQAWFIGVALLAMLTIAYIYSNNFTLLQTPERWMELYAIHPGGGTLNSGEPTRMPRLVLVLSPALAIAGLGLLIAGGFWRHRGRSEEGLSCQRQGLGGLVVGTVLAVVGGFWLFARLPEGVVTELGASQVVQVALYAGFCLAGLAVATGLLAYRYQSSILTLPVTLCAALAIAALVVVRDGIRDAYLAPVFSTASVPVNAQWGLFYGFLGTLVAGGALISFLTFLVVRNLLRD